MVKSKVLVEPDGEAGARLAALLLEAADKTPHGGSSGGDEVRWEARDKISPRGWQHTSAARAFGAAAAVADAACLCACEPRT
jgi:hypothetical protein